MIVTPRCDKYGCDQKPVVYVDKTGEDLCEDHGAEWSEDEKIPIRYPGDQ